MDYYTNYQQLDMNLNSRVSQSESDSSNSPAKPRQAVNARERCRTQSVNVAFNTLRTLIPTEPHDRNVERPCSVYLTHQYSDKSSNVRATICTFCANAANKN
uniref:BHLH domain-containing protein n=1 Tax=Glossina austeni TaxID=7395 RepID=A0A1A9UEE6_GLOAU